ncbi:MAG TPA: prepilin-type N-terminal cleavage/methylation domain-containing protein [Dermatophilaceae bacterium]
MLARLRKAQDENEGGFTLIELLVVIIIIGILAAIAIPVFLNQRKKAVDASMKADLRTIANEEETYFTDNQVYVAAASSNPVLIGTTSVKLTDGNLAVVTLGTAAANKSAYCIVMDRDPLKQPGTSKWTYVSNAGGLQPAGTVACPAAF